jgi:hypothetical protein
MNFFSLGMHAKFRNDLNSRPSFPNCKPPTVVANQLSDHFSHVFYDSSVNHEAVDIFSNTCSGIKQTEYYQIYR